MVLNMHEKRVKCEVKAQAAIIKELLRLSSDNGQNPGSMGGFGIRMVLKCIENVSIAKSKHRQRSLKIYYDLLHT